MPEYICVDVLRLKVSERAAGLRAPSHGQASLWKMFWHLLACDCYYKRLSKQLGMWAANVDLQTAANTLTTACSFNCIIGSQTGSAGLINLILDSVSGNLKMDCSFKACPLPYISMPLANSTSAVAVDAGTTTQEWRKLLGYFANLANS